MALVSGFGDIAVKSSFATFTITSGTAITGVIDAQAATLSSIQAPATLTAALTYDLLGSVDGVTYGKIYSGDATTQLYGAITTANLQGKLVRILSTDVRGLRYFKFQGSGNEGADRAFVFGFTLI